MNVVIFYRDLEKEKYINTKKKKRLTELFIMS